MEKKTKKNHPASPLIFPPASRRESVGPPALLDGPAGPNMPMPRQPILLLLPVGRGRISSLLSPRRRRGRDSVPCPTRRPHLPFSRLALTTPLLPGVDPAPPRRTRVRPHVLALGVTRSQGRRDELDAGYRMKSISGSARTNRPVVCRSSETAQPGSLPPAPSSSCCYTDQGWLTSSSSPTSIILML